MRTSDLVRETYSALTSNKVRSGLTILGIVIGIASVIAMVSIGQGAAGSIQSSIQGLGSNLLTVSPGAAQTSRGVVSSGRGGATTLKDSDANAIRSISGVSYVSAELQKRFQVTSTVGNNTNTTVVGVTSDYMSVHSNVLDHGNPITDSESASMARVAVLGPTTATDLFGDGNDPVGQQIRVNKVMFKVVGVLKPKGGSGFFNQDDIVLVPLLTMQKILAGSDFVSSIAIQVANKDQMNSVKDIATSN